MAAHHRPIFSDHTARCKTRLGELRANSRKVENSKEPITKDDLKQVLEEDVSSDEESSSEEGTTDGESAEASDQTPIIEVKVVAKGPMPLERTTRRRG